MGFYILLFLVLVAGVLAGLFVGLLVLKPKDTYPALKKCEYRQGIYTDERNDEPYQENKVNRKIEQLKRNVLQSEVSSEPSVLQEKIAGRQRSHMVDFNCAVEGIDTKEYIQNRQKKETQSYSILKDRLSRKREKNVEDVVGDVCGQLSATEDIVEEVSEKIAKDS